MAGTCRAEIETTLLLRFNECQESRFCRGNDILMRQNKYLNNIVEQDHRAIKRITRPMLGFKSFWSARILIAGIEIMHMIRKGQMDCPGGQAKSAAQQFYSLAV